MHPDAQFVFVRPEEKERKLRMGGVRRVGSLYCNTANQTSKAEHPSATKCRASCKAARPGLLEGSGT